MTFTPMSLLSYWVVPIKLLYVVLLCSAAVLLMVALALWWRVRREMRASDDSLRRVLQEIERERQLH
jgi:signal transduction histidine kinase